MEIFENIGIKIPNAVLVDGAVEHHSTEVIDFLEQYGDVNRQEHINSSSTEFHRMLVVEYVSGLSLARLSSLLPYMFVSDDGNKFHIQNVSQIYSSKLGGSKTEAYLSDLQKIAKMSGKDYAVILGEMMSQIHQSIAQLHPADTAFPKDEQQPPEQ